MINLEVGFGELTHNNGAGLVVRSQQP